LTLSLIPDIVEEHMDIILAILVPAIPLGLVTLLLLMWNKEKP